jgi:hypothetical protein
MRGVALPLRLIAGGGVGRLVALVACALLAALAHPAVAPAKHGLVTGFADIHRYASSDPTERATWFDRSIEARAGIVNLFLSWQGVVASQRPTDPTNPASASYDFSGIDAAVRDARSRGLTVMLLLTRAPAWAEGPNPPDWSPLGTWKPSPSDLADFVRAVASRYSGGFDPDGAGPAPRLPAVQALSIWAEPNLEVHLTPQYEGKTAVSPGHYREMLNAAYSAVKAVDPKMLVVTGGPSPYGDSVNRVRPVRFYRDLLCVQQVKKKKRGASKPVFGRAQNCPAPAKFDVLAHNPINTSGGATRSAIHPDDASSPDLDRIMRVLRAAERAGTVLPGRHPLWATESWWDSNPPNSAGAPLGLQARWTQQAMYLAWQDGASVFINLLIRDLGTGSHNSKDALDSGIFFANGQPKPSYTAFRFPFVAERIDRRRLRAWGKAPEAGKLKIQRRRGKRWVTVKKLKVGQGAVFTAKLPLRGRQRLRAKVAGNQSLVWKQG